MPSRDPKMNLFGVVICTLFVAEGWTARHLPGLCPTITLSNARVRYRQRGKIARFICNPGYKLAGDRYSVCVGTKWDNLASKCVRANCNPPKPLVNGLIYPSFGGAVLNFYCKSGYELNGANITYCDGVRWDNTMPRCLGKYLDYWEYTNCADERIILSSKREPNSVLEYNLL